MKHPLDVVRVGAWNSLWADGWSVGSRYSHNRPGSRFQESPADDKNDFFFSAICTGIHGSKYYCVLQWMLFYRDPKRAVIAHLTKGRFWTDFCVQLTLGTYPQLVWNKEAIQNGLGLCGSPFHGNEEWHLLQQLWCNTNRQLSYNEKKQLHLVRRFGQFLRRLIRSRTHGEMVISTETDFSGDSVFVDSRQALMLLWIIPNMLVGDFQSKSIPVHKLFQNSGGSKRLHFTKLVT